MAVYFYQQNSIRIDRKLKMDFKPFYFSFIIFFIFFIFNLTINLKLS